MTSRVVRFNSAADGGAEVTQSPVLRMLYLPGVGAGNFFSPPWIDNTDVQFQDHSTTSAISSTYPFQADIVTQSKQTSFFSHMER